MEDCQDWRVSALSNTPAHGKESLYVNPDVKSGNTKKKKWNKNLVSAVRNRFIADMADRAAFGSLSAQRPMDLKYNTKMFVDLYGDKHMKDITNEVLRDFRKRLNKLMAQGKYRKHTISNSHLGCEAVDQLVIRGRGHQHYSHGRWVTFCKSSLIQQRIGSKTTGTTKSTKGVARSTSYENSTTLLETDLMWLVGMSVRKPFI